MRQAYQDFIDYWTIPLSVVAVIIGMAVSYLTKGKDEQ
jgi:hypothetical protein